MNVRRLLAATLIAVIALSGCEFGRRYINKPWGKGTYIPAAACAVVGSGIGVLIQDQRTGSSCVVVNGQENCVSDNPDYWEGALIGAAAGAAVCGLVGHYLLDPEPPTPSPPPPPPTPTPPVSKRIVLRGVTFDFDKSDIRPDSRPVLDQAAEVLRENPNVRVSVEGYTDNIGTEIYNQKLSVRRAEAVFRYLVNHGVAPERMEVVGYGMSHPVADNDTESGRAQNRRVELQILNQTK